MLDGDRLVRAMRGLQSVSCRLVAASQLKHAPPKLAGPWLQSVSCRLVAASGGSASI